VNMYKRGDWNLDEAFSFLKLRAPFELEGRRWQVGCGHKPRPRLLRSVS
jgi:hypothetical protein